MRSLNQIIQKITLVLVLVSALNLSFHIAMPQEPEGFEFTGSVLKEQVFLFIPFSEKENNQSQQHVYSLNSPLFIFSTQWSSLQKTKLTLELLYRKGSQFYREYPFVVSVRNLRI